MSVLLAVVITASGPSAAASARADTWSSPGLPQWWQAALHIPAAQKVTTGKGVTVAVIDSGINLQLPEFRGADIKIGKTGCRYEYTKSTTLPYAAHGSDMTAVIAGQGRGNGPGGTGRLGIAPDAKVLFYPDSDKVDGRFQICDDVYIAAEIQAALDQGADLINLSLSANDAPQLDAAIKRANDMGVPVIVASGDSRESNQSYLYPQSRAGVVTVQAVDRQARSWRYNPPVAVSVLHKDVRFYPWISAPGVQVQAIGYVDGRWESDAGLVDGTSTSAAIITGLLALLKSKYPDATGNQLIQALIHSTPDKKFAWSPVYGFGVGSITEMLKQDPTGWPDQNPTLLTPKQALAKYPRSVYDASRGASSASSSATPRADAGAKAPAASDSGSGVPGWVWLVVAMVLLALVLAGALALRGRGSTGS